MPTAQINGVDLYFERHGDEGEPLVLVHGYCGDVTDWRFQLPAFAPRHRVLIFDHRGHGRSGAPADRGLYSIKQMADDTEALAAACGFERYHLLGHSMGGCVAQEIALRTPERLLSLTLEDTGPAIAARPDSVMARYTTMRNAIAETHGMAAVAEIPSAFKRPPHKPPERDEEEKQRLTRMSVDGFLGASRGMNEWPGTKDRAAKIATPTLVIYGEMDTFIIPASKWLAERIPGAEVAPIPDASHAPQYERPDLFNSALRRHIERNGATGLK